MAKINPAFHPVSIEFDAAIFADPAAVAAWLARNKLPDMTPVKNAGVYTVEIRSPDSIVPGSMRRIAGAEGAVLNIGAPKSLLMKGLIGSAVVFDLADLAEIKGLNVTEVTLTARPVAGDLAKLLLIKGEGNDSGGAALGTAMMPLTKADKHTMRVGGYAFIPNIPDKQKDVVSESEIEAASTTYLKNLAKGLAKGTGTGQEHTAFSGIGYPAASFVDATGIHGVPGGWWVESVVESAEIFERMAKGEQFGYSPGGTIGQRVPLPPLHELLIAPAAGDEIALAKCEAEYLAIERKLTHALTEWAEETFPDAGYYPALAAVYADRVAFALDLDHYLASYSINAAGDVELGEPVPANLETLAKCEGAAMASIGIPVTPVVGESITTTETLTAVTTIASTAPAAPPAPPAPDFAAMGSMVSGAFAAIGMLVNALTPMAKALGVPVPEAPGVGASASAPPVPGVVAASPATGAASAVAPSGAPTASATPNPAAVAPPLAKAEAPGSVPALGIPAAPAVTTAPAPAVPVPVPTPAAPVEFAKSEATSRVGSVDQQTPATTAPAASTGGNGSSSWPRSRMRRR